MKIIKNIMCFLGLHKFKKHKKTRVSYRYEKDFKLEYFSYDLCTYCQKKRHERLNCVRTHHDNRLVSS